MLADTAKFNFTETLALVAAIAALGAFFVSWLEARRNNKAIVKLKSLQASFTSHIHDGDRELIAVRIENRGIALQNICMSLKYRAPDKAGICSLAMQQQHESKISGTFYRGTIAEFQLSDEDPRALQLLRSLRDLKEQEPAFCLYANTFFVRCFPVCRRFDWFRRLWNRLCFRLMFQRKVGDGYDGKGVFKTYILPTFTDRRMQLETFVKSVIKELEKS